MNDNFLTPDGRNRRTQILQLAISEARKRRRRRFIAPGAVTAMIAVVVIVSLHRNNPVQPMVAVKPLPIAEVMPPAPPTPQPSTDEHYITTDPTITDRLTLPPEPPHWTIMQDDEFLSELAAAGQPAGIVYINGKAILLSR